MLGGNPAPGSSPATSLLYAGEQFDTDLQMYYNRARWYNPSNGLFNRADPYAGSPQDPQSLHKYLYVHCNPINNVDPTGAYTLTETTVTVSIQEIGISIAINALLLQAIWDQTAAVELGAIKQEIQLFILTAPEPFTQADFEQLENRIKTRTRSKDKKELYLHYGFRNIAHVFGNLTGLKAPSWGTRTVYLTGWEAKYYLAMYTDRPRDAIYIVLPRSQDVFYYGGEARGQWDLYPPTAGTWLGGGGQQWYFPNGTSPGTVFGPIPIPEGSLSDI